MGINIEVDLWTKHSWMMDIEGKDKINIKMLREMGDWFKEHLYRTAEIIDKLQKNGWIMGECYGAIYHLSFYKDNIDTEKEAKIELKKLGINLKEVFIMELEDEE